MDFHLVNATALLLRIPKWYILTPDMLERTAGYSSSCLFYSLTVFFLKFPFVNGSLHRRA